MGGEQEAGRAEPALRAVVVVKRGLDDAELLGRAEPLDGGDRRAVDRREREQA
jgi:hypothetical protein